MRFFAFALFFSFFVFRSFFFCFVLLFLFCFAQLETNLLLANTYGYMVAQRSRLVYSSSNSGVRNEGKFSHSAPVYGLWLADKPSYPHPLLHRTRAAIKMKNKYFEGVRSDSTIFYKSPTTELWSHSEVRRSTCWAHVFSWKKLNFSGAHMRQ